jgi:uncharacterized lipoprotein NlpE involved in copper resistance
MKKIIICLLSVILVLVVGCTNSNLDKASECPPNTIKEINPCSSYSDYEPLPNKILIEGGKNMYCCIKNT